VAASGTAADTPREARTVMTEPIPAAPTGLVYADVPNRAVAYIIDVIILAIIGIVVFAIIAAIGLSATSVTNSIVSYSYVGGIVFALAGLVISGGYFIYTWTSMRATVGMRVLGMQVGNADDGKTLTMDQAIRRWLALGAPFSIAQAFNPFPLIGLIIGLASFAWFIYLLYTTATSPTKQGFHDKFANTMVVKAARSVG